ncbi:PAS domain-containing protein [Propylenella binzhouense]|uniref:histidine kinase n=1 Tax=Propylenella binzhouense TaxID=2555902 RepID=A0A964WT88_9HYPH|nr:PAS domain-containing protein [Propylenella binzhouense]MYZ47782.1 PAS domain S-box protein [Propylenella binzhouense]
MTLDDPAAGSPGSPRAADAGPGLRVDLAAIFRASPNPYVILDPDLTIVGANDAYLRATMRKLPEIVGRNMFEAFPSDPASESFRLLQGSFDRVRRNRSADHLPLIKYDIAGPDGRLEERYWSATHVPLFDAAGGLAHILQHTVDVTELQRLRRMADRNAGTVPPVQPLESGVLWRAKAVQDENAALEDDLRSLRELFEQAPSFMAVLKGPEHVFDLANAAYLRLVGNRAVHGRPVREVLPEVEGQGFFEHLDRVFATGEPFVGQSMRVLLRETPDAPAAERHLDLVYQPIRDTEGRVTGIFVQGHDITEQRRAEAALRESEGRFRLVAESAPVMLWMGDANGKCVYLNRELRRFWGVEEEATGGFDWSVTLHPDDRETLFRPFEEAMRERRGFQVEARYRRADGAFRVLRTEAQPRFDPDGTFLGMIGVNVDVTEARAAEAALHELNATLEEQVLERTRELREREAALRQAQKMEVIGQLTGGVAHDFNNLLQVIVGNLEILQRNIAAESSRLKRAADNAMNGARRASTLTQRLLAFSRRQPLDPRPLNANRLVSDMSELLHRTLGETISVETVLSAGLWSVEADANQLESAILNLAVNARDAMPDGGKLTIETANTRIDEAYAATHAEVAPGQYVVICVSDNGEGMTRETAARVFEPFFTTKEPGKGTGLGLSMVYGFVKQSGGHVKIYSEPGHGTTVKIYLPRMVHSLGEDEEIGQAAIIPEGSQDETILVVEDDDDVRGYSVEILRELGYRVIEAHDGTAALRLLARQNRVDLLFTDVVLPGGMNGADLARDARAIRPGLKVLFTTGYARDAIVHHGRLDPGVQLITKPFIYADLAAKVRDVLDTERPSRPPQPPR